MANFPQSLGQMTAHEREVANLRYRTRNFTVSQLSDGPYFAIYGPWWAYVSREDAGLGPTVLFEGGEWEAPGPYAFFTQELGVALTRLNSTWDFSVPERYRDKPRAALEALSRATDKSAEDLGL